MKLFIDNVVWYSKQLFARYAIGKV